MTEERKLLREALVYIENLVKLAKSYGQECKEYHIEKQLTDRITALLAAPAPEPVAWMNPLNGVVIDAKKKEQIGEGCGYPKFSVPLYTKPPASSWVRCEDRLPPIDVSVLVYEPGRPVQKTCRDQYDWLLPHASNVTHWMPLPLPPLPKDDKQ